MLSPWRRFFSADVPNSSLTPQQALSRLMEGNQRFAEGKSRARTSRKLRDQLTAGQSPMAAILCCADSRVTPEIIFDQPLGEIFSVRVAGNFLHDDGLASLEYAAIKLSTPLLFVLGHSDCGAVRAALQAVQENSSFPGHLPTLLRTLLPAVNSALAQKSADPLGASIRLNVEHATRELARAQPVIAPMAESSRVLIVGGVYSLTTGRVELVSPGA
jgi:carbonic anhydrase